MGAALLLLAFLACDEGTWLSEQAPYEPEVTFMPLQFGDLTSVSVGTFDVCGVRADGSLSCRSEFGVEPPEGAFRSVSVGWDHRCGVREDGSVDCWGDDEFGQATPPEGRFVSVSAGQDHSCGVREDGFVACWGSDEFGQASPPEGRFVSVSAGEEYSCGVREDGSVLCWSDRELEAAPSDGPFESVSASQYTRHICGVRDDGSVVCWDAFVEGALAAPHDGPFSAVTVGSSTHDDVACGLRENRTIACWPLRHFENTLEDPDNSWLDTFSQGKFISVSIGFKKGCAVREDGYATCWGDVPDNLATTLSVTDRTSNSLTVEWAQPVWEDGRGWERGTPPWYYYQLHASQSPEGPYRLVVSGLDEEVTHVVDGLEPSAVQYLALLVCDDFECSREMAVVTTEADGPVSAPPTPPKFRGKKIVHSEIFSPDDAKLTWEPAAGATYYELWRGSGSDLPFELVTQINTPLEAQSFEVAPNRGSFGSYDLTSWKVRACNKAGCSPFTNVVTIE